MAAKIPVEFNAHALRLMMADIVEVRAKLDNLRYVRARFTRVWRNAYIRHRMRKQRGVLTDAHVAELAEARARYEALTNKCRAAYKTLIGRERQLRRDINAQQKASLRISKRFPHG